MNMDLKLYFLKEKKKAGKKTVKSIEDAIKKAIEEEKEVVRL